MEYIVCKNFIRKGIAGLVNLPKGALCNEIDGVIYHNNAPICFKSSQNAYDYFSRNDDGHGYDRFALIGEILDILAGYASDYNTAYASAIESFTEETTEEEKEAALGALVDKNSLAYEACKVDSTASTLLKPNSNVWNVNFYNADIAVLQHVKQLCLGV